MSLTGVKMTEEVWLTCLTHALSTETEEIMGLLLGDIQHSRNGSVTALIWCALPQPRSDRRKDRVETNPEQLTAASAHAEKMTLKTGKTTRVIGWYHSHPHITVLPSHVDVRTQAMYQLLDSGFIGLIFSCFSEDAQKVGRIQVTAFQSLDGKYQHAVRPVSFSPVNRTSVIDIESSLSSSERTLTRGGSIRGDVEEDTADSGASPVSSKGVGKSSDLGGFFANADARMGENHRSNNFSHAITDLDPMDMSESMQEAMHRSNMEMSGAEFVRKEVPLYVLPASSIFSFDSPLESFAELQRVLYEEERTAYNQAIEQNMRDGRVHPLTYVHHTSTYQASMCKLMEYWLEKNPSQHSFVWCLTDTKVYFACSLSPAISALQDHLRENETQLRMLSDEAKILETDISIESKSKSTSPRNVPSHGVRSSASFGHRDRDLYSPGELSPKNVASPVTRSRKGS